MTWQSAAPPPAARRIGPGGWALIAARGLVIGAVLLAGVALSALLRLGERATVGMRRPLTPWITQGMCRIVLAAMGIRLNLRGARMTGRGGVVANHVSWLDILVLNACDRVVFVAKADVASWPGIGGLARSTGTIFIERDRRTADVQLARLGAALDAGQRILIFPEGTSTDGQRVLPFRSLLFAAFKGPGMRVQPVSLRYDAPPGRDARHYGWWGDMAFGPHLLRVLATWRQGSASVTRHEPLTFTDRKTMALAAETSVRSALPAPA